MVGMNSDLDDVTGVSYTASIEKEYKTKNRMSKKRIASVSPTDPLYEGADDEGDEKMKKKRSSSAGGSSVEQGSSQLSDEE